MRFVGIAAILCLGMLGCSTGKVEQQPVEAPVVQEVQAVHSPAVMLPYTLELEGEEDGEDVIVAMTVHFHKIMAEDAILTITPGPRTMVVDVPLISRIKTPSDPGDFVQKIRISGKNPSIEVSLSQESNGFAVEMHESYPPEASMYRLSDDYDSPLPAPIEIEGVIIDSGIEVKPDHAR